MSSLLEYRAAGLYVPKADLYIDPRRYVSRAIITHAHSDHFGRGAKQYLTSTDSETIMRYRVGSEINIQTLAYSDPITVNGVKISLHPAGHIPGSAQVRLECRGQIAVVSGDYNTPNGLRANTAV